MTGLALALLAAVSWTLGRAILSPMPWPELGRHERLALELTAGLGLTALLLSIALVAGWFAAATPGLIAIAIGGAGLLPRPRHRAAVPPAAEPPWTARITALIFICAAVACAGALAPVTDHDALSYVLPIARHIADAGALRVWSDQAPSMWPQGNQVLLAFVMKMGGDRLGALSAIEWLVAVGAISALARRVSERPEHVPVAIALAIAAPVAAFQVAAAKEDMLLLAATAAALFCLAGPRTAGEAAAAGLFAGIAAGVKYPGLGVALAVLAWIALADRGHRSRHAVIAAACAAAAGGLWYALNVWRFGNPVAPFVFGAKGTPLDGGVVRELMDNYGGGRGALNFFITPIRIVIASEMYGGRALIYNPLTYAGLAGLGFASARRRSAPLFFTAAVLYSGWYLTVQNARLLLPAAMLLAPAAADRLVPMMRRSRLVGVAATLALAVPMLLAPVVGLVRAGRYVSNPSTYLDRETEHHADIRWANTHLDPARARLASVFGDVAYFTIPAIGVEPLHQFELAAADLTPHDRFLAACRRQRITHLFAAQGEFDDVGSQLRVVYENPASRLGDVHFFRPAPSEATVIFEIH